MDISIGWVGLGVVITVAAYFQVSLQRVSAERVKLAKETAEYEKQKREAL